MWTLTASHYLHCSHPGVSTTIAYCSNDFYFYCLYSHFSTQEVELLNIGQIISFLCSKPSNAAFNFPVIQIQGICTSLQDPCQMISHQLSGGCCYRSYICSCTVRLCSSNMVTLMLYCVHEVSSPASLRAQIRKLFREPCVNSNYTAQHPRSCLTLFLSLALLDIFTYCIICLHTLHLKFHEISVVLLFKTVSTAPETVCSFVK